MMKKGWKNVYSFFLPFLHYVVFPTHLVLSWEKVYNLSQGKFPFVLIIRRFV